MLLSMDEILGLGAPYIEEWGVKYAVDASEMVEKVCSREVDSVESEALDVTLLASATDGKVAMIPRP